MRRGGRLQNFGTHSVLVLVLLLASALIAMGPRTPLAGFYVDRHSAGLVNPAALESHKPIHIRATTGSTPQTGFAMEPASRGTRTSSPTGCSTPPSIRTRVR